MWKPNIVIASFLCNAYKWSSPKAGGLTGLHCNAFCSFFVHSCIFSVFKFHEKWFESIKVQILSAFFWEKNISSQKSDFQLKYKANFKDTTDQIECIIVHRTLILALGKQWFSTQNFGWPVKIRFTLWSMMSHAIIPITATKNLGRGLNQNLCWSIFRD